MAGQAFWTCITENNTALKSLQITELSPKCSLAVFLQLATHAGSTEEVINVEIEHGSDLGSGGNKKLRVTVSLDAASNSGTEDVSAAK